MRKKSRQDVLQLKNANHKKYLEHEKGKNIEMSHNASSS